MIRRQNNSQTRRWSLYTKARSTKWRQYVCLVVKEDLNSGYLPRLPTRQDVRIFMWGESEPVGLGKISPMTPHTCLSTSPDVTLPFSITSSGCPSARRQTVRQVNPNRLKRQIWTESCQSASRPISLAMKNIPACILYPADYNTGRGTNFAIINTYTHIVKHSYIHGRVHNIDDRFLQI